MNDTRTRNHDTDNRLMTPNEVAARLRVTSEKVRQLIRTGRLEAMNIGGGKKRPLYRIHPKDLDAFLTNARQQDRTVRGKRFRRPPPGPDFFPDLR